MEESRYVNPKITQEFLNILIEFVRSDDWSELQEYYCAEIGEACAFNDNHFQALQILNDIENDVDKMEKVLYFLKQFKSID